ncbi:rhombotarget lipoprotein [Motilimonas sp. KMU-193]|uniref:rhombotarget lipoprotein n=1 Tax=Motilimonas sp. KMU-193 TaxID=3388668 RepID=UPI00396B0183
MKIQLFAVLFCLFGLTACSSLVSDKTGQNTVSSSLVDFLYPNEHSRAEHKPEIPTLNLPVKVGIAFVPPSRYGHHQIHEKDQLELLNKVKSAFTQYDYIDHIEVIPSTYLQGGKGFTFLSQLGRLYDIDVIALVSYDQVSQSKENNAALLYWTIVGMYLIPGNQNSVQTFVDTAVFDISSQKMLFRAPGISELERLSTAIGVDDTISDKSREGFALAVDDMTKNLDAELARFKTRVKEEKVANITHRDGYSGGGSMGYLLTLLLMIGVLRKVFNR